MATVSKLMEVQEEIREIILITSEDQQGHVPVLNILEANFLHQFHKVIWFISQVVEHADWMLSFLIKSHILQGINA